MAFELMTERLRRALREIEAIRERANFYRTEAAAGRLSSEMARSLVKQARSAQEGLQAIPRTAATAAKVVEEWNYSGTIASDFTAIEDAIAPCADWVASRSNQLWNGYGMATAYPWAETIPVFTSNQTSGLQTNLTTLIAACDVFLGNIQS